MKELYGIGIKKGDVDFCEFINMMLKDNEDVYNKVWVFIVGKVEGFEVFKLLMVDVCS